MLHVYQSFGEREGSEGVEEKAEQKKAKVQGKEKRERAPFFRVSTQSWGLKTHLYEPMSHTEEIREETLKSLIRKAFC